MNEDGNAVQPLFVSLDHEMTSLEKMRLYIQLFHPLFIGFTGSKPEIYQAAELYDVRYRYIDKGEEKLMLEHSSKIFFHGKDGKVKTYFPHEASAEWLAAEMTRLILKDKNASTQ
ncbi:MAG: SCO family protein [Porticoccus sp.]